MRIALLCLIALGLLGCGRIDSGNKPVATPNAPTAPTITIPDNTARPSTTTADTGSAKDESRPNASPDRANPPETNAKPGNHAEPDNTAVNDRDTNRQTREPKLPIDQKETQHDIDLTAKIRQRVLATVGMSINGRNVKIITADGHVTLRGPVDSTNERDTIARIAREVAGEGNVEDQIEVKSPSASNSSPNP